MYALGTFSPSSEGFHFYFLWISFMQQNVLIFMSLIYFYFFIYLEGVGAVGTGRSMKAWTSYESLPEILIPLPSEPLITILNMKIIKALAQIQF